LRRLLRTSVGESLIELDRLGALGWTVNAAPFGTDGWADEGQSWMEEHSDEPLEQYLARHLGVPLQEARELAEEILGPWGPDWERRSREERREAKRLLWVLLTVGGVVVMLAALGVALAIWLLVD